MDAVPLHEKLWQKIKDGELEELEGTNISFRIPVQEDLLNFIVESLISSNDAMKDFKKIHFRDIALNQFTVDVNHKKLNKSIRGEISRINYDNNSEPVLSIYFIEGIKFYEKLAIDSTMAFRKGWNWFKTALREEPQAPDKSALWYELSSDSIKINLAGLLRQQKLEYLNRVIVWEKISAEDNRIIFKFSIKT